MVQNYDFNSFFWPNLVIKLKHRFISPPDPAPTPHLLLQSLDLDKSTLPWRHNLLPPPVIRKWAWRKRTVTETESVNLHLHVPNHTQFSIFHTSLQLAYIIAELIFQLSPFTCRYLLTSPYPSYSLLSLIVLRSLSRSVATSPTPPYLRYPSCFLSEGKSIVNFPCSYFELKLFLVSPFYRSCEGVIQYFITCLNLLYISSM
jgi:hypothetical protein